LPARALCLLSKLAQALLFPSLACFVAPAEHAGNFDLRRGNDKAGELDAQKFNGAISRERNFEQCAAQ
jgi:hypothetical protein